jgi:hypothetical protein
VNNKRAYFWKKNSYIFLNIFKLPKAVVYVYVEARQAAGHLDQIGPHSFQRGSRAFRRCHSVAASG